MKVHSLWWLGERLQISEFSCSTMTQNNRLSHTQWWPALLSPSAFHLVCFKRGGQEGWKGSGTDIYFSSQKWCRQTEWKRRNSGSLCCSLSASQISLWLVWNLKVWHSVSKSWDIYLSYFVSVLLSFKQKKLLCSACVTASSLSASTNLSAEWDWVW